MRLSSPFSRIARTRRALHRGQVALERGDLAEAEMNGRASISRLGYRIENPTASAIADLELLASSLELVAVVRRELADLNQSAMLHEHALAALEATPHSPYSDRLRITVLNRLGECRRLLGRYAEAEDHHKRAVSLAQDLQPTEPMWLAESLNGLGIVYKDTHRFADAGRHYHRALELAAALGPDNPRLANLFHNLAGLDHAQNRFVEGEPHARRALRLRMLGEEPASTGAAGDLAVLGALLLGQHRYAEAEQALQESLTIWQNRYGEKHYEVAVVQHNLAALHAARGQHQQAERAYRQALDIKIQVLGPEHPDVVALKNYVDWLC